MSESENATPPPSPSADLPRGVSLPEYPEKIMNPVLRWEHGDVCFKEGEPVKQWYQNFYTLRMFDLPDDSFLKTYHTSDVIFTTSNNGKPGRKLIVPNKIENIQHEYSYIESPVNSPRTIRYICTKSKKHCGSLVYVDQYVTNVVYRELRKHKPSCAVPLASNIAPTFDVSFFDGRPHIPVPRERVVAFGKSMITIYLKPMSKKELKSGKYYRYIFRSRPLNDHAQYRCENCHSTLDVHCKPDHTIELHEHNCHEQCLTEISDADVADATVDSITHALETTSFTTPITSVRTSVKKSGLNEHARGSEDTQQDDDEENSDNGKDRDYVPGRKKRGKKARKKKSKK